jgi:hypothetical protein
MQAKDCCYICECEHTSQYPYCRDCKVLRAYLDDPIEWQVNFDNRNKKNDTKDQIIKLRAALKMYDTMQDSVFNNLFDEDWLEKEINGIINERSTEKITE